MRLTAIGITFFCFLFVSLHVGAQSLYPVSLDEKINKSSLIIEGKVVQQAPFWNPERTMIYTSNTIEVYKFFKGRVQERTIEVITLGGSLDGHSIKATELLSLDIDQIGIFFLMPNGKGLRSPKTKKVLFDVYSSSQGFLQYDLYSNKATAPFARYDSIESQLYKELTTKLQRSYENINSSFRLKSPKESVQTLAHTISSFTPTTVNAGALLDPVNNILTINGSGFGTGSGSAAIIFDHADDGSGGSYIVIPYNHPLVMSWTDAQIQIRVPSEAGTGVLSVRDAAGVVESFSTPLTVNYSVLNSAFNFSGTWYFKEANLMNSNGSGGYTISYSSNTANSGIDINSHSAKSTFQRALSTWKENIGFNITEGSTTMIQSVADDDVNVIMFDNTNTGQPLLPDGVLGVCYSYASMCGSPLLEAQHTGFDIVIRNPGVSIGSTNFTFGPCPPMASNSADVDLESVLLHELGHAIGLGHINDGLQGSFLPNINPGKVMNYAIANGVRRTTPDYSALAGATYLIQPQGNTYGTCGLYASEMTPTTITSESKDNCPLTFPSTPIPSGTIVNFDLAHTTSNRYVDPSYMQVTCNGAGTSVSNNAYYAFRTSSSGGSLNLSVNNYATTPSALTTCTPIYGYPVTGVKLALYQVNACPVGQSFPAPVACRTFSANGALTTINGLTANSNYLLYVDGIENTKASFSLTFDGTIVLPLRITTFKGTVNDDHNYLAWQCEDIINVEKLVLQRSFNGVDFYDIASFSRLDEIRAGTFKDFKAAIGNNIYRLIVVNNDQSKDFSSLTNLKRATKNVIALYPNPAKSSLTIRFNNLNEEPYSLKIYNSLGQIVLAKQLGNVEAQSIPVSQLPKGLYQAVLLLKNEKIETYKFTIE